MPVVPLTIAQIRTGLQSGFSLDPADQFTYSIPGVGSTWEGTAGNYDAEIALAAAVRLFDFNTY